MTTLVPRKRKIDEVGASQEALYSGSPPRQRMRFNSDLASLPQSHEPTPLTMNTEDNLSDNAYVCPELPTEIWLEILTSGSLSEACQAQLPFVCRSWYEISKHQALSWWNIKEGLILKSKRKICSRLISLLIALASYPNNGSSYLPVAIEFRKLKSRCIWGYEECHYNILTKNGQIQEAFAHLKDSFVFESSLEYYNYAINVQEVGNMREISYHVDIQINMRMLEKVVAAGHVTTNALYALAHQAKKFIKDNEITSILDRESSTPKVPLVISTQPEIIKDVKLHQYQIDAINWMVHLELDPKSFTIKPWIHVPKSDLMIRVDDLKFVTRDQSNTWTYCSNGGILADEIGLGKSLEIIGLIASNPPSDLPLSETHFAIKATLIICPSHLVKQWSAEISKYCGDKLRVIELPTIKQVRKWNYQDVLDADAVIMSYSLCSNEHYLAHPDLIQFGVDREETYSDRKARLKKLYETRKTLAPAKVKGIVIEHFHWHRVVIDEYHEMDLTDLPYRSNHTWLVSGTPVITKDVVSFIGVRKVRTETSPVKEEESASLEEEKRIKFSKESEAYIFTLKQKAILKHLFWRNTKESVKQQFEMVESTEEVVKLEFTPLEASIYEFLETHPDETSDEDLLNFCCETTDETEGTEISLQKLREEYLSICASGVKSYTYKLDRCREKYLKAVERIANQKWAWNIKEDEQTVKDFPDDSESIQDYINHFSEYQAKIDSQKASGFKNPLIDKYGTKLGNLIAYLRKLFRKNKEARVIIFSKYGPYLRLIGSILKASRVTYTVAGGNVLVKANAIRKFKEENVRVILLNLNTDASGLTLIEASHVILMDPMHGDKETALAYEQQAVGRAKRQGQRKNVTVVKFIVKNTIEEEIYNTNNDAGQ